MKDGLIIFRFRSECEFDSVRFQGESIHIKELKKKICNQRKITQFVDKELLVYDFQTNKEIVNETLPTNCQVIVWRKVQGPNDPIVIDQNNREIKNNQIKYKYLNSGHHKCNICYNNAQKQQMTGCCSKLVCKGCFDIMIVQNQGVCSICDQIPKIPYVSFQNYKENQKQQQQLLKQQQQLREKQLIEMQMKQQEQLVQGIHKQEKTHENQENNHIIQSQQIQQEQQMQIKKLQDLQQQNQRKIEQYNNLKQQERNINLLEKYLTDARYFIIKSNNEENLQIAKQHNEWATTISNQNKLIEAFNQKQNVILLFSVNKSAKFQGFARMDTNIQNYQSQYWKDKDMIRLGGVFKIKWLKQTELSFVKCGNYKNPLNNNDPIKKSRDTTELPPEMGYEICNMFEGPLCIQEEQSDNMNIMSIKNIGNTFFKKNNDNKKDSQNNSLMSSRKSSVQEEKQIIKQPPSLNHLNIGMNEQPQSMQQQQNMFQFPFMNNQMMNMYMNPMIQPPPFMNFDKPIPNKSDDSDSSYKKKNKTTKDKKYKRSWSRSRSRSRQKDRKNQDKKKKKKKK